MPALKGAANLDTTSKFDAIIDQSPGDTAKVMYHDTAAIQQTI